MTIGACATSGGIQALRNLGDHEEFRRAVYPRPGLIESLAKSKPVAEYVTVDAELCGCPISPAQLLELLTALTVGRRPQLPDEAVCLECKRRGNPCILVAQGVPCLGPVTRTGCGALCPAFGRGCYGCFGPREQANTDGNCGMASSPAGRPPRRGRAPVRRLHRRCARLPAHRRRRTGSMTHGTAHAVADQRFEVGHLTRVEGEGSLTLHVEDGRVVQARLGIFEAPRYFERLVVGRTPDEVIDIVARICGICPVAYQMSAVHAFEQLAGIEVDAAGPRPAPAVLLR